MDIREKLLTRQRELEQTITRRKDDLMIPLQESTDELSLYDQHPADVGSELFEREKDSGLLELLEFDLQKVNDALERYDMGQYGICESCGKPIEPARLERLINTTLCVKCAKSQQKHFNRPAEEEIVSPGHMSDLGEAFQIAGYEFYEE